MAVRFFCSAASGSPAQPVCGKAQAAGGDHAGPHGNDPAVAEAKIDDSPSEEGGEEPGRVKREHHEIGIDGFCLGLRAVDNFCGQKRIQEGEAQAIQECGRNIGPREDPRRW